MEEVGVEPPAQRVEQVVVQVVQHEQFDAQWIEGVVDGEVGAQRFGGHGGGCGVLEGIKDL